MLTRQPVIAIEKVAVYTTIPVAYSQCSIRLYSRGQGKMNRHSRIFERGTRCPLHTEKPRIQRKADRRNQGKKERKKKQRSASQIPSPSSWKWMTPLTLLVPDNTATAFNGAICNVWWGGEWRYAHDPLTHRNKPPKKKNKREKTTRRISDTKTQHEQEECDSCFGQRTRVLKRTPRNHARRIQPLTGYRRWSPTFPVICHRVIEAPCHRPKVNQAPTNHALHPWRMDGKWTH